MAQHDYIISNQTFPNTRADLNNVLQAIATCNKGSSAPTTQYAGQMWIDDSAGTTWTLYLYDGSDNIQVATIDTTANTINFIDSVVTGFDIVTDTTPQLGGTLDTNGNPIQFADNVKAQFGTSNDLEIYHDGSNSVIKDGGTGDLRILATDFRVKDATDSEFLITGTVNAGVALYHDNSSKLQTTSTGATVTGDLTASGGTDTRLKVDGSTSSGLYLTDSGASGVTIRNTNDGDLEFLGVAGKSFVFNQASINTDFRIESDAENSMFFVDASANRIGIGTGTPAETVDINAPLKVNKAYISETTLTDGATISWNMSTQSVAKVTLGGNRTISAPSNGTTGQFASLLVIQDGTGSRTLTWNAVYEFASDTAPTLTTTASKGDLFVFRYNGTKWLEVGRNQNLTLS